MFKPNFKLLRFSFCVIFFTLSCISGLAQHSHKIQKPFYISNDGNNANTGTSPDQPWKTLKAFHPGAAYLFKCRDTFYLSVPSFRDTGNLVTVISSYGNGTKPVICNYRVIYPDLLQATDSPNIWKVQIDNKSLGGYKSSVNANVGFIMTDAQIFGNKLRNIDQLHNQWDFCDSSGVLYIYSGYKPQSDIRFVCNGNIINLSNNLWLENLVVEGTGGHAIQGADVKNTRISNITIKDIGGSYLPGFKDGFVRYGNGIELGNSVNNCLIEDCNISNVYDAALTMQSRSEISAFTNIVMRNNTIKYCEQSFEVWQEKSLVGFKKCLFINNDCSYAGYGWSHDVRPNKIIGAHILVYFPFLGSADIRISGNTFKYAKECYMILPPNFKQHAVFTSRKNKIILNNNNIIRYINGKLETTDPLKVNATLEKSSKFIFTHK